MDLEYKHEWKYNYSFGKIRIHKNMRAYIILLHKVQCMVGMSALWG